MHQHIGMAPQYVDRAVKIMDAAGIGVIVNLGTGTVTRGPNGEPSEFQRGKQLTDAQAPSRFVHYMILDYAGWDSPDFSKRAVGQINEGHRLGSAGLKEFKRLGLYLRDGAGKLIRIDSPEITVVPISRADCHKAPPIAVPHASAQRSSVVIIADIATPFIGLPTNSRSAARFPAVP